MPLYGLGGYHHTVCALARSQETEHPHTCYRDSLTRTLRLRKRRYLKSLGALGNWCGETVELGELGRIPIQKFFPVNGLRHDCPSQYRGRARCGISILTQIGNCGNTTGRRAGGLGIARPKNCQEVNLRCEPIP